MELHLVLEGRRDLAVQIHRQLREAILSGRLAGGTRLPPSRLFAEQLGVSRKTVAQAYERLALERLIVTQVGAGSFVASRVPRQVRFVGIDELGGRAIAAQWQGMDTPMRHPTAQTRSRYEFVGGASSARLFPQAEWRQCVSYALRRIGESGGYYSDAEGLPVLREAISRHVGFSRGVDSTLDDIIVTNGAQQALDLVARVLIEPGSTVVVEEPGYLLARRLFEAQRANVVSVPVDAEGLRADLIPDGTRMIYTTPAHQFPLGMPMRLERRTALLARAEEVGAIVVEDDYDSEFRYDANALASLKSLDRAGVVAYVNSFSKTLSPDLRLGYIVAPPALRMALLNAKHLSDRHSPLVTQWALARFITQGHLLKHVRRCHAVYGERRTRLLARLEGDLARWLEPLPANAGFHLAALFKRSIDVQHFCHLARRVEVGLYSLEEFHRTPGRPGLLMGFGAIEAEDIDPALDRVREVLEQIAM
jgi:GntR family transcriptional regulator/MocR family aminotransferase